jgi:hypothetical protein
MKTAAEINAEKIEDIINDYNNPAQGIVVGYDFRTSDALKLARRIVEAFPELRPHQQSVDEHGRTKPIAAPLPWARP